MKIKRNAFNQLVAMTPVNHIDFILGYCTGWVPQVLSWLSLRLTVEQSSYIGSLYYVGRAIGSVLAAILADRIGRSKLFVAAATLIFVPFVALLCYEAEAVLVHYAARLSIGIAGGVQEVATGIYIGENCSPASRGLFNCIVMVYYMLGMLVVYVVGTYCAYTTLNAVGAVFSLVTLVSTCLLKEPANFLIMKGRVEKAERNFRWLRAAEAPLAGSAESCNANDGVASQELELEFRETREYIQREQEREQEGFWRKVSTPEARRSLRIVIALTTLLLMTGFAAINAYITIALKDTRFLTPSELTIVYGCVQFVMMCCGSSIVDKFNRRTLFIGSSLLMTATSLAAAVAFMAGRHYDRSSYVITMLKFAILTLHIGVYVSVSFPLTAAVRGEILPQNVKALGSGLTLMVGSVGGFLVAQIFLPIAATFGMEYNFFIYAAFSLASLVYVYVDLPETRGKTLVHIQNELNKRK